MNYETSGPPPELGLMHTTPTRPPSEIYYSPASPGSNASPPSANSSLCFNSPSPSSNNSSKLHLSANSSSSKRGRPKSENLTNLIIEGKVSPSTIKCRFCGRVFPRDKSLNAHERIHTGLRPYVCDFPNCSRAFTQSGQLKTHQRLHTGERPFKCSVDGCTMRFTHANRHCPNHPYSSLIRCDDTSLDHLFSTEQNVEVLKWLERYRANREEKTPKRKSTEANDENVQAEQENCQLISSSTGASVATAPKSRKGLKLELCELDMNAGQGASNSPKKLNFAVAPPPKPINWNDNEEDHENATSTSPILNPKKRWLRDACWQVDHANSFEQNLRVHSNLMVNANTNHSPVPNHVVLANQNRPTVLMIARKDQTAPLELSTEEITQL